MKYDLEQILADIKTTLLSDFNTKLTAITTEKNDSISLPSIAAEAYCLQSLNKLMLNYNPFIWYGVGNIVAQGLGPLTKKDYTLSVVVIHQDFDQDDKLQNRMFRYARALEEVFSENWIIQNRIKCRIEEVPPSFFKMQNSNKDYIASGINIFTSLG